MHTPFTAWQRLALAICFSLVLPVAHGELIGTDQVEAPSAVSGNQDPQASSGKTSQASTTSDKAAIQGFVSRADIQKKMQDLGLSAVITAQRIALLNDAEARQLADKINALPAGGNLSNLSSTDIIILLLGAILLVLVV